MTNIPPFGPAAGEAGQTGEAAADGIAAMAIPFVHGRDLGNLTA